MRWEILSKKSKDIVKTLLKNRKIKDGKDFFDPKIPGKLPGVDFRKAIKRIKAAKKNREKVIVYGDYDADGICATAIAWEALYSFGVDALPYIPERFGEGYGINPESVEKLKTRYDNLGLIVTVDNGIVAYKGLSKARDLGIDVVVVDHHTKGPQKLPTEFIVHTTSVCGSALAYFFAEELGYKGGLELAAIGTIADQMSLVGINRAIVKHGLEQLSKTKRPGLLNLFESAGIKNIGTYEVNYAIAPRLNAAGRISHGLDSLRLLCTKDPKKSRDLAAHLNRVNSERQKIVEEVVVHARRSVGEEKIIILGHETYHEGVIGLAASRLVDEFYRPAIVLSRKGNVSKASARSVPGFNIIDAIRQLQDLYLEGGGHPMAAGFSIETKKIGEFSKKITKIAKGILTEELLARKLRVDLELDFGQINFELLQKLLDFEPFGLGNPTPTFVARKVEVVNYRVVGQEGKHLKLNLKQDEQYFDAIFFGGGEFYSKLHPGALLDIAYQVEDNSWNGKSQLQLKIKDIVTI